MAPTWNATTGCPVGKQLWPAADRVQRLHFSIYHPDARRVYRSVDGGFSFKPTAGGLPEGGRRIVVWDVNSAGDAAAMRAYGVDFIVTDDPESIGGR